MKKGVFYFALVLVSWALETSLHHFPFTTIRFDFLWLLILYCGFTVEILPGLIWVFLLGWGQEVLGSPLHGPLLLSSLLVYLFLRITRRHLFLEGTAPRATWVFLMTVAQKTLQGGLLVSKGYEFAPSLPILLGMALLQSVTALAFFPFLQRIRRLEG